MKIDRNLSIKQLTDLVENEDIYNLVNKLNPNEERLIDSETGENIPIVRGVLQRFLKNDSKLSERLRNKDIPASFGFNPYDRRVCWQDSNGSVYYNQYQQPAHAKTPRTVEKLPEVFDDFLSFLFDEVDEAKEHFINVLATMLNRRVETIQCLVGTGGIGKNTLVENFLPLLVGSDNHAMARQHEIKTNFTKWAENKQVIVYDEVSLNDEQTVNTIKSRTNETFVVEGKGVDSLQAVNYATSFILSNNLAALGVFVDDRRSNIYPLTETPMKDALDLLAKHGGSEVAFRDALLNPETVANVYWYLRGHKAPSRLGTYKDENAYENLKSASMKDEDRELINNVEAYLRTAPCITFQEIFDNGWAYKSLSINRLDKIMRSASNHNGKMFRVGRRNSAQTQVNLAADTRGEPE